MPVRIDALGMGSDESLVKTGLEMMSSPPVTTGMALNVSAKRQAELEPLSNRHSLVAGN